MTSLTGPELWNAVDEHLVGALLGADPVLEAVTARNRDEGLPSIAVAPVQGKLLNLLARMVGARTVLEVGTLGGYSTIWLARALPADGRLVTLELDPHHASVARQNLVDAGVADRVSVIVGPALETLAGLSDVFDFAFIDADKANNASYASEALRLSHPGSVIVIDNTVRQGRIADLALEDADVVGTRELHAFLAADPRVDATALQTVGSKGYDGMTIALVR